MGSVHADDFALFASQTHGGVLMAASDTNAHAGLKQWHGDLSGFRIAGMLCPQGQGIMDV